MSSVISQLENPIDNVETVLELLSTLLVERKNLAQIQRTLLLQILPTWSTVLPSDLVTQFFAPDPFTSAAGQVALSAYGVLLTTLSSPHAIPILERLVREYPVDRIYRAIWDLSATTKRDKARMQREWEDIVKDLCMVPAKVANALQDVPESLENRVYFENLSTRVEELISSSSSSSIDPLAYLLQKLVNIGLFPPTPPPSLSRAQPSFFRTVLPTLRHRPSTSLWPSLLRALPSLTQHSVLASLFVSLRTPSHRSRAIIKQEAALLHRVVGPLDPDDDLWDMAVGLILSSQWDQGHASVFIAWLTHAKTDEKALKAFLDVVLERWASPEHIRHSLIARHKYTTLLLLLTLSSFPSSQPPYTHLTSSPPFIRGTSTYISHISPSIRRCGMLVAEEVARGAGRALDFGGWEGDDDILGWARSVRVLIKQGMEREGDGDEDVEALPSEPDLQPIPASPVPHDPDSDDDSLLSYASHPHSHSPSPTPSHLASIESDPTLSIGVPRVQRPVYLLQLVGLVRSGQGGFGSTGQGQGEPHEADKIQMALDEGEVLVRRKRGFGSELSETAVTLVHAFLGLNDNFELDGFVEKRQGVVTALVVCCPEKAAPTLIEEFFKNQYSIDQRFVVLNALALGARELAGLSNRSRTPTRIDPKFPSRKLPGVLHRKYLSPSDEGGDDDRENRSAIPGLVDGIVEDALSPERAKADGHPEIVRERRLRLGGGSGGRGRGQGRIVEVEVGRSEVLNPFSSDDGGTMVSKKKNQTFIAVAAEYFICPLIARFWLFLRDAQALDDRQTQRERFNGHSHSGSRYRGAGTSMLMHPLVLSQFARTLAVLVHTAKNAPEWMALVGPGALEVAVCVGVRGVGGGGGDADSDSDDRDEDKAEDKEKDKGKDEHVNTNSQKHASVLLASLSLALTVLSCALELDGGRVMCLEHAELVLGCAEWAGKVFASLERGVRVREGGGGGGGGEADLVRTAAGVLLKIEEIRERWGVSMVDLR